MNEGKRPRRRRGRRGGQRPPQGPQASASQNDATPPESQVSRRDTRRRPGDPTPSPASGAQSGVRRAPQPQANDRRRRDTRGEARSQEQRPPSRREGSGGGRGPRDQDRSRSRENLELPPQDPVSIELGAAFKEAHQALRDAIRALEKRKAEHGDEPAWLVEQLQAAEAHFTAAADAWTLHLEGTGRKPVARVR